MGVLDGKVAIVTGSNRGIGLGIARAFAREGARLMLAARDAARLESAVDSIQQLGAEAESMPTDVAVETAERHGANRAPREQVVIEDVVRQLQLQST